MENAARMQQPASLRRATERDGGTADTSNEEGKKESVSVQCGAGIITIIIIAGSWNLT